MTTAANPPALKALLRRVYEDYASKPAAAGERAAREFDFEFHMTDWMGDFVKLGWAMFQPGTPPTEEAVEAVYAFLVHAVPHLNAAYETIHGEPVRHPFEPTAPHSQEDSGEDAEVAHEDAVANAEVASPELPKPRKRRRAMAKS